ncbi:alpha-2-macroglobulin family protein [Burkholderia plantarii]|uniref:alpha-2-macroglobulin family protein n=1 Tax=Burkholderia plantarii TaxID=41899 RepID=UPI0018DBD7E5|nr:MG2 domain-containing protein [Burkholderia plantarii]MBI0329734.1 alpha-2-macroglobulin [Burkholderia plantarii]
MKQITSKKMVRWSAVAALVVGLGAGFGWRADAARTVSVSPQGTSPQVSQAVVKFDEPMVAFGSAAQPDPAHLSCNDAAATKYDASWSDARTWLVNFRQDLPPGVSCTIELDDKLRSVAGHAVTGPRRFTFQTGGPYPATVRPGGGRIEERQLFVLKLTGPATEASVRDHVWCEATGIGNRIPVTLADADTRGKLLDHFKWKADAARVLVLGCAQALPPGVKMQLVFGKGVASPSGIANDNEARYDYEVREPFAASFSCERENAKAPCTPLRPVRIEFNAPIARADAEKLRLQGPGGAIAPTFKPDDKSAQTRTVEFAAPLPASAELTVTLPAGLTDDSGRPLDNADLFPLKTRTAAMPPLAKFSSSTFGIIERYAEPDSPALVPVTLRNVEADLKIAGLDAGRAEFANIRVEDDSAIRDWMRTVERLDGIAMSVHELDAVRPGLFEHAAHPVFVPPAQGEKPPTGQHRIVDLRSLSLLAGEPNQQRLVLPKADPATLRPFEVVGVPIAKPGFYVLELASPALGRSLMAKPAPMYVRTTVLVTNLGVHFKQGRDNSLVWVTTLDKGKPVPNAEIRVSDCNGETIASGRTNAQGLLAIDGTLAARRSCDYEHGYRNTFVSARVHDPVTGPDMAFVIDDWNRGIERWRFDVPTEYSSGSRAIAHTVFDRTLVRAGETVSMKHYLRVEQLASLGFPKQYPNRVTIRHLGSGDTYHQPLVWAADHTADSSFTLPPAAKLGEYAVTLDNGSADADDKDGGSDDDDASRASYDSGSFRVEAFRLPVFKGTVGVRDAKTSPLVGASEAPVTVQLDYVSGGPASNLPVRVSALVRPATPAYLDRYPDFSFSPYRAQQPGADTGASDDDDDGDSGSADTASAPDPDAPKLVADKLPVTLDRSGAGNLALKSLPKVDTPRQLSLEATFADPNGEIQTIRGDTTLWPAALAAGIKAGHWVAVGDTVPVTALAIDLDGKPHAGAEVEIHGYARVTTSSRKRMVGGFYAYDDRSETSDLGTLCSGKTDDKGRLDCDAKLKTAGEISLVAVVKDGAGRAATGSTSVWVVREDELWFGGNNTDRIDLIPEKPAYEPGETARFQVRMPFRFATALVAVERSGVMETHVVQLNGRDPSVELKVEPDWGPNVYVSVLALRGRLREVPWYSFFTWGWKTPIEWAHAFWNEGRHYVPPTPLVDLSKPAFRYGVAEIKVGIAPHRLGVTVTTDAASYPVRGTAHVKVAVKLPDGRPAPAGTQVAVAAVDEALLELMPNDSWDLLGAMLQRRGYGVETATAQMEIVGRRHFGRKAVPAGGGGGAAPTRELFDTLLLWNPRVTLDARGEATLDVKLNDALTRFSIVAIASTGADRFGTGRASVRSTQDLQLISGLPPLAREGDALVAPFTLRNTTSRAMKVVVTPNVPGLALAAQTVDLAAGASHEVSWRVAIPDGIADAGGALPWSVAAAEQGGAHAADALKITQRIVPSLPVTVQQATLTQVDGSFSLPVAAPAGAAADRTGVPRGGISVALQARLADGLPGVTRWFERYPYRCIEQQTSRAIGLHDPKMWQSVVAQMPAYLDRDGLANYFPADADSGPTGSTALTAYLLSVTDEAARLDPRFAIPDALRSQLEAGLASFVDGRITRDSWAPRQDLELRKLAAIEALSRHGAAQARMLGSLTIAPERWPTSALLDYHAILSRISDIPQRDEKRAQVEQLLRARITYQGTQLVFSTARDDDLWWLMSGSETNAARLALEFNGDAAWKDEMPRILAGLLALQRNGAWQTTTSNALGQLAVERFSRTYESTPVTGQTLLQLGAAQRRIGWGGAATAAGASASASGASSGASSSTASAVAAAAPSNAASSAAATRAAGARQALLPWPAAQPAPVTLTLTQEGTGKPWATIQSLAAVALKAPFAAGYRVVKTVTPVDPAVKGVLTRGDVLRVKLDIDAQADMTWVAVNDPVPAGATILGSGLGRDSAAATQDENAPKGSWPVFVERDFDGYRAYYDYLPKGHATLEYTVRLNAVGTFGLPPTRVEALYAPSAYGVTPNAPVVVQPAADARP